MTILQLHLFYFFTKQEYVNIITKYVMRTLYEISREYREIFQLSQFNNKKLYI